MVFLTGNKAARCALTHAWPKAHAPLQEAAPQIRHQSACVSALEERESYSTSQDTEEGQQSPRNPLSSPLNNLYPALSLLSGPSSHCQGKPTPRPVSKLLGCPGMAPLCNALLPPPPPAFCPCRSSAALPVPPFFPCSSQSPFRPSGAPQHPSFCCKQSDVPLNMCHQKKCFTELQIPL